MSSKLLVLRMMAVVSLAALLVASLAGCNSTPTVAPTTPPLPTASPQPTINPQPTYNAIQTQAAQTVIANLTQNAPAASLVKPTSTVAAVATSTVAAATSTLAPTVAPTATSIFKATSTVAVSPTVADGYGCILLSVLPRSTDDIAPSADFDAYWTVLNSGFEMWTPQEITIRYVGGTNLQKNNNTISLNTVVRRGEKYAVGIDMRAPADPGVYQSNWSIKHGSVTLCALNLTIVVRNPNPTSTPQP